MPIISLNSLLLTQLEALERKEKYVDLKICPKCKSLEVQS